MVEWLRSGALDAQREGGREEGRGGGRAYLVFGDVLHPGRVGLDHIEEVHLDVIHCVPIGLREGGREGGREG